MCGLLPEPCRAWGGAKSCFPSSLKRPHGRPRLTPSAEYHELDGDSGTISMALFLVLGLLFIAIVYSMTNLVWTFVIYLCFGIFWFRVFHLSKPLLYRPAVSPFVLVLLWPAASVYSIYEHYRLSTHPERFIVLWGGSGASSIIRTAHQTGFAAWEDAMNFASKEAGESGHPVTIRDKAVYGKEPLTGEATWAMYEVQPSGETKRVM